MPISFLPCTLPGCERKLKALGWCNAHYLRWRKYGDPLAGGPVRNVLPRSATVEERFWAKVNKNGPIPRDRPDLGPCWVWTAALQGEGVNRYGAFTGADGRQRPAHLFSWEWENGPIPAGKVPDHLCRNCACVRPSHLEPVTQRVNVLRGVSPIAEFARVERCPSGHPYDEANTYRRPKGGRGCRACRRDAHRRWKSNQRKDTTPGRRR